jgi:hypothetical protein
MSNRYREENMRKGFRPLLTGVLLAGMMAACSEVNDPGASRVSAGVLQLAGAPAPLSGEAGDNSDVIWTITPGDGIIVPYQVLTVPDTVPAGEPFRVTVQTIGEGGCWSAHSQEVSVSGRTVELRPYDVHSGADACTMILLHLKHESELVLQEPGEWILRVSGRRLMVGGSEPEVGVSAEKRIVVR